MKVRYTITTDFEIEDELIESWEKDSYEYDYPYCIDDNITECLAYHLDPDIKDSKSRIHVINYSDNLDEIITMVKIRGEKLLRDKIKSSKIKE